MVQRSVHFKVLAIALSLSVIVATAPFSVAETIAGSPLGTIVTNGNVTVGNTSAPTGTTIFSGDKVSSLQPTLVNFNSGSRIEMTKSAATFSRQGKTLVIQADQGLLRFNFPKGEEVQIVAGKFRFSGGSDSERTGELGVNQSGHLVMTLNKGSFKALNTETGASLDVTPAASVSVTPAGPPPASGSSGMGKAEWTAAIIAGVAAGFGLGWGIKAAVDDKSPSD